MMIKLTNFLTESSWCQGWYARNADDEDVHFSDKAAVRFSLMGALLRLYPNMTQYNQCQDRLASLIRILHNQRIEEFNDSADWQDVEHILEIIDL